MAQAMLEKRRGCYRRLCIKKSQAQMAAPWCTWDFWGGTDSTKRLVLFFLFATCVPEFVSHRRPFGSITVAFFAEMVHRFRRLQIGGMCTGLTNHFTQLFWIFEHRTRTKVVVVKWLTVMVGHKKRRTEYIQKLGIANVGVGVVYEGLTIRMIAFCR